MQYYNCNLFPCGECVKLIPGPMGPQGATGPTGITGPTGATGSNGTNGLSAYGGLYNAFTQPLTFPAVNTYIQIGLNTPTPLLNVTAGGNNTLTIVQAGDYEINYNILLNASRAIDVAIAVRNNGMVITATRGVQTMALDAATGISFDGRLSASTIVTLPAGSVLDLAIQVVNTLPTGLDAIINGNANTTLTVKKLN